MDEFNQWNKIKIKIGKRKNTLFYYEREIWWCALGKNIGKEINGKGEEFTRPVLILKKINRKTFIGLPLTHTLKEDTYHTSFYFDYDLHCVNFAQIRTFDSKRLIRKMGALSIAIYQKIMKKAKEMF